MFDFIARIKNVDILMQWLLCDYYDLWYCVLLCNYNLLLRIVLIIPSYSSIVIEIKPTKMEETDYEKEIEERESEHIDKWGQKRN